MKTLISRVGNLRLRQMVTFFLATVTFFTVAAFSQPSAQALPFFDNNSTEQVDPGTVNRIQQKAEDFGGENIGDTGLKNIRKLPENVPETADLIIRQRSDDFEEAADTAKEKVQETAEKAERAID